MWNVDIRLDVTEHVSHCHPRLCHGVIPVLHSHAPTEHLIGVVGDITSSPYLWHTGLKKFIDLDIVIVYLLLVVD